MALSPVALSLYPSASASVSDSASASAVLSGVLLHVLALLLALVIALLLLPVPVLVVPPALYQLLVFSLEALYLLFC